MRLPSEGLTKDAVMAQLETFRGQDIRWREGRAFGYVYDPGREAEEVGKAAYVSFLSENALDPTAFPSMLKLETDLVAIGAAHLGGDPRVVSGNFTSGGTESIFCAVKAARDHARATRGITDPEIVLPTTAHAAFHKASHYMGLKVVPVDVVDDAFVVDVAAMEAAMTPQTVMLVGSSPSYGHAVVDPIPELAELAERTGVWLHVDACVGGWLLPYFERLGEKVTPFDFRLPGVSSISMDLHKYAFCPKAASLILYRDRSLRKYCVYACAEWTGYTIINTTVQSTKGGGPMAGAWATLNYMGDAGYLDIAKRSLAATKALVAGIESIDGLEVMGEPAFCMAAAKSSEFSVFHVIDEMKERGWYVQPQLSFANSQENIHFSLQVGNLANVEPMLKDLALSCEAARSLPYGQVGAQISKMFASIDPASVDEQMLARILGAAGIDGVQLPEKMAEINEMLNALPRPLSKQLLIAFVNDLYAYQP